MRQTKRICTGVIAATLGLAVAAGHSPPAAEPTLRSSNDASRLRETIDRLNQQVAREATAARAVESARIGLAYALLGRHRFREALAEAREVAHRRPEDGEVLALLGDIHFGLGKVGVNGNIQREGRSGAELQQFQTDSGQVMGNGLVHRVRELF